MNLNPKDTLFGQPILRIRAIAREAPANEFSGPDQNYLEERAAKLLKTTLPVAREVIRQMIQEDYLTVIEMPCNDLVYYRLETTEKGQRLAVATANPPISRKKAESLLQELIERAKEINANLELAYYVERLHVFGSYLSDKPILGDLDVFYKFSKRYEGEEFNAVRELRIDEALENGRNFKDFIDQHSWPEREPLLMLKTKKKGLSLHDEETDGVFNRSEHVIVFEYDPRHAEKKERITLI